MRRVAVTGLGAVTPLGLDAPSTWGAAVAGRSGVGWIEAFDASEYPVRIAAEVKGSTRRASPGKEARRMDRNVLLAVAAAQEAWSDAASTAWTRPGRDPRRLGDRRDRDDRRAAADVLRERGFDRVSPFFIPSVLVDTASGQIAISLGIKGQNFAPVSACATGSTAVGEAAASIGAARRTSCSPAAPRRRSRR